MHNCYFISQLQKKMHNCKTNAQQQKKCTTAKQICCNTNAEALMGYSTWKIIILLLFSLAFLQDLVSQASREVSQEISCKTCNTISRKNFLSRGGARLDSTHSLTAPLDSCRDQTLENSHFLWLVSLNSERGLLNGTDLISPNSIFDYWFRVYFGTATYVDYLAFSHLNLITNPTPMPNATLTIGATARNPNYWGSHVYPNYRGSQMQP